MNETKKRHFNFCSKKSTISWRRIEGLTYPDDVYRVIKMPRSWVDDDRFLENSFSFQIYFLIMMIKMVGDLLVEAMRTQRCKPRGFL